MHEVTLQMLEDIRNTSFKDIPGDKAILVLDKMGTMHVLLEKPGSTRVRVGGDPDDKNDILVSAELEQIYQEIIQLLDAVSTTEGGVH